ncbi:unnamed protein product, partial [Prorocentrum cordatum]
AGGDGVGSAIEFEGDAEERHESQPAPVRARRGPMEPTQAELEQREAAGHAPFRDWCYFCMAGRGRADGHPAGAPGRAHAIPTFAVDYGYLAKREEVGPGQSAPAILAASTQPVLASALHDVLQPKGTQHECNVARAFSQVEATGHPKIIYKSDGEGALVALKREATIRLRNAKIEVVPGQAPAYDSVSNGLAEVAVREVKGVARSPRVALSLLHGADIPNDHPVLTWLVAHAAGYINRGRIGADGRTPHERHKGMAFRKVLPPFCEKTAFLPSARRETKFEERWKIGVFLGATEKSSEMLVGNDRRNVRIPTVIDEPPVDPTVQQPGVVPEQVPAEPRNVYIRRNVELAKSGFTDGCQGCHAARANAAAKAHSPERRERIQQATANDPELAPSVLGAAARQLEAADRAPARQEGAGAEAPARAARAAEAPMEIERPGRQAVPRRDSPAELPQASRRRLAAPGSPAPCAPAISGEQPGTPAQAPATLPAQAAGPSGLLQAPPWAGGSMDADSLELCALLAAFGDWRVAVSEQHGPGRFTSRSSVFDLEPGTAYDIRTGYDFSQEGDRQRAQATIELEQPLLVTGSPMRAPWSNLQALDVVQGVDVNAIMERGIVHLVFCAERYKEQIKAVARGQLGALGAGPHLDEPPVWDACPEYYTEIVDNISGAALDPELAAAGRREEMEFPRGLGAYAHDSKQRCREQIGRDPAPVARADVNKGDDRKPNVRNGLCAAETRYRTSMDLGDPSQTFSATPPHEALRMLISFCCSPRNAEEDQHVLMFLDITRARPHCEMKRKPRAKLPPEDPRSAHPDARGLLARCLYGCRDAGQNFELLVRETLEGKMGFSCGVWCPCIYRRGDGKLAAYVYGDNFALEGSRHDNLEYCRELQKHMRAKLEGMLGPNKSAGDVKEAACLNRIFRWTSRGDVELEAGSRHARVMLQQLGLWRESNALSTAGAKPKSADRGRALEGGEATRYRSLVMPASCLSEDRPDIKYAVKEAAKCVREPCEHGMELVKSDFASCLGTRKSTSCGVFQLGDHMIKVFSATQGSEALSSGEADWHALVHTASCGVGLVSLARDMGYELELCLAGDATAASGIAHRRGAGRIRHIETKTLCFQRHVTERRVIISKTLGKVNVADLGTKHLSQKELDEMLELLGYYAATGKSGLALAVAGNLLEPEPACDHEGDEEVQA